MRYLAVFFMIVFLLFAYLQLNDPDPIWWVTLYLIPAYISFWAFKGETSFETLHVLIVLYLAYAINSFLQMTCYEGFYTDGGGMEMKTTNQELAREGSGLLICISSYLIYYIYFLVKKNKLKNSIN